ncbi:MAG TPA: nitroreductase [Dehalococcoidales bacterium]|nr:nitroreductase [Dehalococcoidales bacterium]
MNETIKVIKNRRSIRKYKAEQIGDAELRAIMEAAMYAPSAMNQQKWHFTVVQNPKMLDKMAGTIRKNLLKSSIDLFVERAKNPDYNVFFNAPTVVLITADEKAHFTEFDCGAATENIALAAESLNIGSCVIGMAGFLFESEKADEIKKELGIPEGYKFIISVALGYKDVKNPPVPPKNKDVINYVR